MGLSCCPAGGHYSPGGATPCADCSPGQYSGSGAGECDSTQWSRNAPPAPLVSVDVVGGSIVFGGTAVAAGNAGIVHGSPSIVAGPSGALDAILFESPDWLQLGVPSSWALGASGVGTGAPWTVDCHFKTPIPQTGAWHTLTRGNEADHHIIISDSGQG